MEKYWFTLTNILIKLGALPQNFHSRLSLKSAGSRSSGSASGIVFASTSMLMWGSLFSNNLFWFRGLSINPLFLFLKTLKKTGTSKDAPAIV